jgi:beta-glucosidase
MQSVWTRRAIAVMAAFPMSILAACQTPPASQPEMLDPVGVPAAAAAAPPAAPARDPEIEALIARMTVEEKAGQLSLYTAAASDIVSINPNSNEQSYRQQLAEIRAGRVGGLFNGRGAVWGREVQEAAMESRLKIPLILGGDVIHGYRTIFPVPLAEAASFEPALTERTHRAAAREAAATGMKWNFAPMVDIGRDQRWGRVVEGAGEDVLLGQLFAAARVRGLQGDDLAAVDTMVATPKHFAAYGAAQGGADYNTVDISERTLRETYLPPFRTAFDAGALTTMSAFNEVDGVPATANPELLTGILRGEWGFEGFVVSDFTSEQELIAHGVAGDGRDAARLSINAGLDMSMQSGLYMQHLPELVASGEVSMQRLDDAVRRVLTVKKTLGLFDDPFRFFDVEREKATLGAAEHRALAREAGRRSIVMLKNQGELLPLKRDARIALIGPFARGPHHLHGPWVLFGKAEEAIDLATGIERAMGGKGRLTVLQGSDVEAPLPGGIDAAVAAAKQADVVLLAVGEAETMSAESNSRTEIVVPAAQQALVEAVAATGKPVVILLRNGRALALHGAVKDAPAILVTWFLGSEMGNAVADVLFGDYGPGGRLPVSFPIESGQQPFFYAHKPTGRPSPADKPTAEFTTRYLGVPNQALYPFGHGLTYGRIAYDPVRLSTARLPWDGTLTVTARVANTGRHAAEEVVQLYVRDRVASVTRPVRELKGFEKIRLEPGESREVSFTLKRADFAFLGRDLRPTVEPGEFDVWVSPSAATGEPARFELLPG